MFKAPVPAKLPHYHTIIQNLGQPREKLANFLDLTVSTVRRYELEGQAPRPVMLSLFWETSWGQSIVACDATNYGRLMYMQNIALHRQIRELQQQVHKLQQRLDKHTDGAANAVFFFDQDNDRPAVSP